MGMKLLSASRGRASACLGALLGGALAFGGSAPAEKHLLKIATLAPPGSAWMKVLRALGREVRVASEGQLVLKYYPGGIMGDEHLVVSKMEDGQLQGAALTSVGLGKIAPAVLVQQLPFLLHGYRQLDCLRQKLGQKFTAMLEEKGYKTLGWGDVGFWYFFSNSPVARAQDLQGTKLWAWTDDPVAREWAQSLGATPKTLGVPDVLPALQTGLIDTFFTGPYVAIALQWFTHVKFMTKLPVGLNVGAVVVKKEAFDKLPANLQEILLASGAKWLKRLVAVIRRDTRNSIKVLREKGIQVVEVDPAARREIAKLGQSLWPRFVGSLYSADLLEEVKSVARGCR